MGRSTLDDEARRHGRRFPIETRSSENGSDESEFVTDNTGRPLEYSRRAGSILVSQPLCGGISEEDPSNQRW